MDVPAMDEENVIRLRNAVLRVARRLRTSGDPEGLTATQSSALTTLVREGPMRAGDLAEAEALNPTLLSRILGRSRSAASPPAGPTPTTAGHHRAPHPGRAPPGRSGCARAGRPCWSSGWAT